MTVASGRIEPDDDELNEARRRLEESQAARAASQPLIQQADNVLAVLGREDVWARSVSRAFQERRGA